MSTSTNTEIKPELKPITKEEYKKLPEKEKTQYKKNYLESTNQSFRDYIERIKR